MPPKKNSPKNSSSKSPAGAKRTSKSPAKTTMSPLVRPMTPLLRSRGTADYVPLLQNQYGTPTGPAQPPSNENRGQMVLLTFQVLPSGQLPSPMASPILRPRRQ